MHNYKHRPQFSLWNYRQWSLRGQVSKIKIDNSFLRVQNPVMPRLLRIEYENAFYHVITRGERRDAILTCPAYKEKFLIKLGETAEKYRLLVHAYVLMDNHYHMLVETPQGNLSQAMHYLNAG